MTEAQIGFLYKIAGVISNSKNEEYNFLKSYYLMRCKDITRGYGLPDKHFSSDVRCPNCCIEWNNSTAVKVRSIKLSKRQKKRLKCKTVAQSRKASIRHRKNLIISNELKKICSFCKKETVTPILKPQKSLDTTTLLNEGKHTPKNKQKYYEPNKKYDTKKNAMTNFYANALDVFSMHNKNNILVSAIKETPKTIKNNKKKKDKFAGLCEKAVLASAKLKESNKKQNNLDLFLKPSQ